MDEPKRYMLVIDDLEFREAQFIKGFLSASTEVGNLEFDLSDNVAIADEIKFHEFKRTYPSDKAELEKSGFYPSAICEVCRKPLMDTAHKLKVREK